MAKLVLSMDGLVLQEFYLDKPRITIGRRSTNDIQINNLAVSGEHAAIVTILNDSFLEDLHSTNGTQVNGRNIKKCVLHHNDEIGLGKYKIKYLLEAKPEQRRAEEGMVEITSITTSSIGVTSHSNGLTSSGGSSNPNIDTHPEPLSVLRAGEEAAHDNSLEHQMTRIAPSSITMHVNPPAAPSSPFATPDKMPDVVTHAALRILNGSNKDKELPLTKEYTLLGKNGGSIAAISRELQCYYIAYVEGDPRPLVNRNPLGDTPHRLNNGDSIEVSGIHMIFLLKF